MAQDALKRTDSKDRDSQPPQLGICHETLYSLAFVRSLQVARTFLPFLSASQNLLFIMHRDRQGLHYRE